MNTKYIIPRVIAILVIIIGLASCEEEFSSIGAEVIGGDGSNIQMDDSRSVLAYSRKLLPVESNNLPLYQLGVYNDPTYGKSTVNLLSQVRLSSTNPEFGDEPILDSVVLYVPFFSEATQTEDGITYTLDSLFGNSPIDISLFESNFLLRELDPSTNFEERQKYFSNQGQTFENFLGEEITTINDFVPSNEGFVFNEGEDDEENVAPGIRVLLPVDFFTERIIEKEGDPVLLNNNNFVDFFRGIYFQVTSDVDDENLFLFDIGDANITLFYSFDDEDEENGRGTDDLELSFNGVNVNVFENEFPAEVQDALDNPDIFNGEENLFLKGGDGIVSVIELFGEDADNDGVPEELEELRNREWLVNEANLIFYVDENSIESGQREPERVIIFDATNQRVLTDYANDITASQTPIVDALTIHLGRLERGTDNAGDFYKIRITDHISNLINNDSTNVPLGLMVSQNVLLGGFQDLQNSQAPGVNGVPSSSVISPEGTILFGNNTANEEKRLKLQIFYTEPN
ncbi:DUF4270 domain-containing protein [Patiriisocius hiemis]|uniref:DUF4270 domain-containing protein n=1 Tax=Patiriisocius hiemis TaxID=3075604 RepID=A0ABU2YGU1_9FLAO|nr:DUF4270 domain-containing protein [Constantimarinum sp. W242]MDT0556465.1 DUF4270 domain-containing protein [Constantimarinum sp. W242]